MITTTMPKTAAPMASTSKATLQRSLAEAKNYAGWVRAARALDESNGSDKWKARDRTGLYDYATIRERRDRLRTLRRRCDHQRLVYTLEEGVHGNLGGMGKPILYSKAYFGTKRLITSYVDEVVQALLHVESLPAAELGKAIKLDFFKRASHCYGRSALMFSSGGMLMYFHFGVAKSLFEQGVLPSVLSGSSAGALVCAVLGTRSNKELRGFFTAENICFGKEWRPNTFERVSGLRRIYGTDAFEHTLDRLIPDLTFREAFENNGRHFSISVSPRERHHSPRLLNAITSPHVLIRSAVRASCAVPGLFEPVRLQARNARGKVVPYLNSRWVDGVFAADLPAKQLARLYGTNHYIVSYINPFLLPTFRDHKLESARLQPLVHMVKSATRNWLKISDRLIGKYIPLSSFSLANKLLHDILSQNYVGDISIVPQRRLISPMKLVSPNTPEEIAALMLDGERQTWPRIEMIRVSSKISRTLDDILMRLGEGHDPY